MSHLTVGHLGKIFKFRWLSVSAEAAETTEICLASSFGYAQLPMNLGKNPADNET